MNKFLKTLVQKNPSLSINLLNLLNEYLNLRVQSKLGKLKKLHLLKKTRRNIAAIKYRLSQKKDVVNNNKNV